MQHVFIIGSKGIPGAYGGYETFVDKLTEYHQQAVELRYHVACKNSGKEVEYHNARCFRVKVPDIGPAQAIYYDVAALKSCCIYIEKNKIEKPVIYIYWLAVSAHLQRTSRKKYIVLGESFM